MKMLRIGLLATLIAMSLAAGGAKLMMMEQEIALFHRAGLNPAILFPFGLVQVVGALLAILPKTRRTGAMIIAVAFMASAIMLLVAGSITFGLLSLIPAILSVFFAFRHSSI